MPRGGCLCGKIRIAYYGEPNSKVICHCTDCRKISGSTYGVDLLIPTDRFFVTAGDVRKYQKPADSGRILTSHFCGDCGTTLFRECYDDPSAFGGAVILKLGVLDAEQRSVLDDAKPTAELFVGQRVGWVTPIEGAEQREGMR
ncbi:unnamed protein product [Clonostachys byssicola]|uniref:CENP-V/GFA domain-containing protein n=1 Tax=Clonostachys byssicola TaxID=160290 RepID=A0A9N9Y9R1_9HYPO|nr:unnamed protein product [Clonostachys byssicola]